MKRYGIALPANIPFTKRYSNLFESSCDNLTTLKKQKQECIDFNLRNA